MMPANPFAALRRNSPPFQRSDEYGSATRRRSRYNGGSKEGRRRRDAGRQRNKHAAVQMLDEKLCQDVDKTLRRADVRRVPAPSISLGTARAPVNISARPNPISPPTPPAQLPYFNFRGLELVGQSPQPAYAKLTPLPPHTRPAPTRPLLPSWCPDLPAFVQSSAKPNEGPLSFDLSKLPEPLKQPKTVQPCRELQLWRPRVQHLANQQVEAIPPTLLRKPHGGVPTTAYRLHHSDRGVRDAATQTDDEASFPTELYSAAANSDESGADQVNDHPANLWRILRSPEKQFKNPDPDLYVESFACQPIRHDVISCAQPTHHLDLDPEDAAGPCPSELENTEIPLPFVHANSLTGYANERGTFELPDYDDARCSFILGSRFGDRRDVGLNELVVDQFMEEEYADAVLAALAGFEELPVFSASTKVEREVGKPEATVHAALEKMCKDSEALTVVAEEDAAPGAHFRSEQALFNPLPPSSASSAGNDPKDTITTSPHTHSTPFCFCESCTELPELIDLDSPNSKNDDEEEEWTDFLALTSTRTRSPSVSSAWEAEWGILIGKADVHLGEDDGEGEAFWDSLGLCSRTS